MDAGRPKHRRSARRKIPQPLAYVRWAWRDWRSSTARAVLSPLARGIYRELLDAHYAEADCALPDDDRILAGLAGVDSATWDSVKESVLMWLPTNADGRRQNPRALAEWSEGNRARSQKRNAGKHGADVRWGDGTAIGSAKAQPTRRDGPSPSPLPLQKKKNSGSGARGRASADGAAPAGGRPDPKPTCKGDRCTDVTCCDKAIENVTGRQRA